MRLFLLFPLVLLLSSSAWAQDDSVRRVVLTDGSTYVGTVEDENADPLVVVTRDGIRREFARDRVALVAPLIRGRFFRTDPVGTRFFFAPTARTLGGGAFRGDLALIYPSITAGLSDRVDVLATGFVSFGNESFITPLVGLKGLVYDSPSAKVALGTSALVTLGGGAGGFVAVPYGVVTLGDETRAVSFGVAGALGTFSTEEVVIDGDDVSTTSGVEIANGVLLGLGGEVQLNNGVKLLAESFVGVGEGDSGLLVLPGVRFFGNRFAFDVLGFLVTDFREVAGLAPVAFRLSYAF